MGDPPGSSVGSEWCDNRRRETEESHRSHCTRRLGQQPSNENRNDKHEIGGSPIVLSRWRGSPDQTISPTPSTQDKILEGENRQREASQHHHKQDFTSRFFIG